MISSKNNWLLASLIVVLVALLAFTAGCASLEDVAKFVTEDNRLDDGIITVIDEPLVLRARVVKMPLADVFFDSKNEMPAHLGQLEENMQEMVNRPIHMLLVFGHTDITGRSDSNLGLGLRRANTVAEFYATLGVPPDKIITVTCGEDAPQCSEDAALCHQANRRVRTLLITEVVTTP